MSKVYLKTLGCKVNTHDSQVILESLRAAGFVAVDDPAEARVAVINTCSVTANADKEARYLARRIKRTNPGAMVVATGCYAQTDSAKLIELQEIDLVVPNEVKENLVGEIKLRLDTPELLPKLAQGVKAISENKQGHFKSVLNLSPADPNQTRAFLKIQDGCNGFCTYCLIPYARGQSRSVQPTQVYTEVRRLLDQGIKEIVFTGIHLGDYGKDLSESHPEKTPSFAEILSVLFSWPDMCRVRISSLEPAEVTPDLVSVLRSAGNKFCPHFHLPLQSGSDSILKAMRRKYTSQQYFQNVELLKGAFPLACIGADVIPGFPGETAEEAQETRDFVAACGIHYLHVFPYSKRPNTAAARMPGHLDPTIVKTRAEELRRWSKESFAAYQRLFIGQTVEVLWEHSLDGEGRRVGISPHYLSIVCPLGESLPLPNTLEFMQIKGLHRDRMLAVHPRDILRGD